MAGPGYWNESLFGTANFTIMDEEGPYKGTHTRTDLGELSTPFAVISLCALLTNLALLVALIARVYHYSKGPMSQKTRWARLHFLGVLCVVHVIKLALTLFVVLPSGEEWLSLNIFTCRLSIILVSGLQLLGWLYLLAIGIQTFFQVYHPSTLVGRYQFVFWLLVHPCLWIFSLAVSYGAQGQFYNMINYDSFNERYKLCFRDHTVFLGIFEILEVGTSIGMLLYIAFISAIGVCLIKPVPSYTGQDHEMLRWIIKTRVNATVFVVAVALLAGGTNLAPICMFYLSNNSDDYFRLYFILQTVEPCLQLVYPVCCLILRETGLCSLIHNFRRGASPETGYALADSKPPSNEPEPETLASLVDDTSQQPNMAS